MRLFAPLGAEEVPLAEAAGRVLARDVVAARAQPPFAASAMDGYAVRAADADGRRAGCGWSAPRPPARASPAASARARRCASSPARRCPRAPTAMVIQEDAERRRGRHRRPRRPRRRAGTSARPAATSPPAPGSPRRAGCGPADLALLAAMNAARVTGRPPPGGGADPDRRRAGDAGRGAGTRPDRRLERLRAEGDARGGRRRRRGILPIARDTPESLAAAFGPRRRRRPDRDARRRLGRRLRPGAEDRPRPRAGARLLPRGDAAGKAADGRHASRGVPLVGLPGNPVSAMVSGRLFLRPAVERMQGLPGDLPAPQPARLGGDLGPNGPRAHYMRARVEAGDAAAGAARPFAAPGQLAPDACWPRPTRSWSGRRAIRRARGGRDG